MRFTLNGIEQCHEGDKRISLMDYLTDLHDSFRPDSSCAGTGRCGACTVRIDGRPVLACTTPLEKVEGCEVTTADAFDQAVQNSFAMLITRYGPTECRYCLPETVSRISVFLRRKSSPTYQEALRAMDHHLCYCVGRSTIAKIIVEISEDMRSAKTPVFFKSLGGTEA